MGQVSFLGSNCFDEYYLINGDIRVGNKYLATFKSKEVGGMIGNAASVFAGYGGQVFMIDFFDTSQESDELIESLSAYRIHKDGIVQEETYHNGKCIILLSERGERTILVVTDNDKKYCLSMLQKKIIMESQYLYTSIPDIMKIIDYEALLFGISKSGTGLVLDIEGLSLEDRGELDIIKKASVIFINEYGLKSMQSLFEENILETLRDNDRIIVLTLGEKGSSIYHGKNEIHNEPIIRKVIDTTGAGDTFNASFLFGLSRNWDITKCGRFASVAASEKITRYGARGGVRKLDDILALM